MSKFISPKQAETLKLFFTKYVKKEIDFLEKNIKETDSILEQILLLEGSLYTINKKKTSYNISEKKQRKEVLPIVTKYGFKASVKDSEGWLLIDYNLEELIQSASTMLVELNKYLQLASKEVSIANYINSALNTVSDNTFDFSLAEIGKFVNLTNLIEQLDKLD